MAWPIYSERFILAGGAVGYTVYVVPAGHRLVLRDIAFANGGAQIGLVQVGLVSTIVYQHQFPASEAATHLTCHKVAYAGEHLFGYIGASGMGMCLSGFLFTEPAGQSKAGGQFSAPTLAVALELAS